MPVAGPADGVMIELVPSRPDWPQWYARHAGRIRSALGDRVLLLEHVGSTSVPGLAAKPVLDICLTVPDPDDEARYVPRLAAAGYQVRLREPGWFRHRLLVPTQDRERVNLHLFGAGSPEALRMIRFRDRLRTDPTDRALYDTTKRALAARRWASIQHYADAKSEVIEAILSRCAPAS